VGLRLRDFLLMLNQGKRMKLTILFLCATLLGAGTPPTTAQQPGGGRPSRVGATVVLVDSVHQRNAAFVIVRRPGASPADLILVRSDVDAAQLSDAIRGLLTARQADGDVASTAATFRVRPQQRAGTGARPVFPWAPRVLNDLRRAAPREISGVGRVRAVEIWLPRQGTGRTRARA
jgi:hypothetical protein